MGYLFLEKSLLETTNTVILLLILYAMPYLTVQCVYCDSRGVFFIYTMCQLHIKCT